jgi:hypothetical protein
MFLLPPNVTLALKVLAVVGLIGAGWYGRGVYQGYLDNEAAKGVRVEHEKDVVADESAGLLFGTTLNEIAAATTTGLTEIHHANLKPKTITIYVKEPGEVVCPVRSQWTPDAVRLFNDPGSAATPSAPDGRVHPVR